ncbi:MAG TPA: N-methyl-L-tryptophan oxidase [Gemmatimonadales bacterium]|nr:N-methyl-L-tryptophan oxidase [Gemmatimonadales bacterium]
MAKPGVGTVVVGLGAMGSAAAYQLARRGASVIGLDRYAPPHTFGSTHGETRVTRQAIGEGEEYSPFALRSHEIWREVEQATGTDLLTLTGGLIISSSSAGAEMHVADFLGTTIAAAQRYGIPHEVLDAAEIRRRFPPFRVKDEETGYFEPGAGFVRPERCVAAQLLLAQRHGATLRLGEEVLEVRPDGGGAVVRTASETLRADQVVLTAGPWLPKLAPELGRYFPVTRQVLYWFAPSGPVEPFLPERFPVFIWEPVGLPEALYGFPAIDGVAGGVKVASAAYGERVDPDQVRRVVTDEEITAMYRLVERCFSGISPRCVRSATCLYTVTADAGFVIDRHPEHPQIVLVSPCSGHGFKHSAAIGEAVAEWITEGRSRIDLAPFGLGRLERSAVG